MEKKHTAMTYIQDTDAETQGSFTVGQYKT